MTPTDVRDLTPQAQRLAALLPAMLLSEDAADPDRPLLRLLEVLAAPLTELEDAVGRLARDPFVARASAPALPLLAELVGARLLGDDTATHRMVVARTVAWRRRKGTRDTLEDVLTRTSGWPAEVDEGFRSLLVTQDVTEPLPSRGWTALLWDPVATADPLTRRARTHDRHPSAALDAPRAGDDVTQTLHRLGAPDAVTLAASPRTVDLDGWARPDAVAIRTSRVTVAERDGVELAPARALVAVDGTALLGLHLDPGGADAPVAARVVGEVLPSGTGYTAVHEPPPAPPEPRRPELLTPTDLAADPGALASGDALTLTVDDVLLVGGAGAVGGTDAPLGVPAAPLPLAYAPPGTRPVLRFAEATRPGPGETWSLAVGALEDPALVATTLAGATPSGAVAATNPVVLRSQASRTSATVAVTPAGRLERAGAHVALRLERTAGALATWRRAADGTWTGTDVTPHPGEPVSDAVVVTPGGPTLVRLTRTGDTLALARRAPGASTWTVADLDLTGLDADDRPGTAWLAAGPAATLVPDGAQALLLAPSADGAATRAWRLTGLGTATPGVTVADVGPVRPPRRVAAAACLADGEVWLHGGQPGTDAAGAAGSGARGGGPRHDLWSLVLTGPGAGRWRQRRVRDRLARTGGALLATVDGLVRVGGAGLDGGLAHDVHLLRPAATRPLWEPLAPLPVPAGPGVLVAWSDAAGLHALVWADRVHPRAATLRAGDTAWHVGPPEPGAPHAPAEGEGVVSGDEVLLVGPSPLPPSEVVVSVGGRGHLVFLPALDLAPDEVAVALVRQDASTVLWFTPGTPTTVRLRLGRAREAVPVAGRRAPAQRLGAPGRLAWVPLEVQQASLGPWDEPVALDLDGRVALDPRLGRLLVPAAHAGLRPAGDAPTFTAHHHVARGAALGAGFAPADAAVPVGWLEPPDPDDPDRFTVPALPPAVRRGPTATVGGARTDGAPTLQDALTAADGVGGPPAGGAPGATEGSTAGGPVVAVVGSPRLAATTAVLAPGTTTTVLATDPGAYPYVTADVAGASLTLVEGVAADPDDPAPHVLLAGLALAGTLDLALTGGTVDLRWCDLGLALGGCGVRVAGAGHHTELLRATPADVRLVLRLHGCRVAGVQVPPWVQVVAAGCTFDAGSRTATALDAPGARLRLRGCTVRGGITAGVLEASSSVLAGPVVCDRPDLGWLRRCVSEPVPGRRPRAWRGVDASASFLDGRPAWPHHLVLDDNNPAAVLTAGDGGRPPGAHADRGRASRELTERTDDFLPLGLAAYHSDRAAADVHRMGRSRT
ncbi:phage tail protein [Cellulomonas sp. KH9]|uniref:phage tail protein n=1 Tax=Cellulomonas sp. KH9 TaxID=1855324 RepID=UPI0008E94C83|nr:phage tail protein [Cellulomonas sp. KH9]SFK01390.1 Phage tail protein (Tail_P2_I) [Cellulomonas sp. KH9]